MTSERYYKTNKNRISKKIFWKMINRVQVLPDLYEEVTVLFLEKSRSL